MQHNKSDLAVIGAGGCGLTAALVAAEQGLHIQIVEADQHVGGSTAMSAGIFVAAESQLQRVTGDNSSGDNSSGGNGSWQALVDDIQNLNHHQGNADVLHALCRISGPLIDWLVDRGVPLEHMAGYRYPGMSHDWMVAPPSRHGADIVQALAKRVRAHPNINLLLSTSATALVEDNGVVCGIQAEQASGDSITIGADAVLLAAAGFGANQKLVAEHLPELADASYYGTPHATGAALHWGQALGAATDHMSAHQSHSSIAAGQPLLVTTYLINSGAIHVNRHGLRFGNELDTYAEHAVVVQTQPDGVVVELFDERIFQQTLANYPRFSECIEAGIVHQADSAEALADHFQIDAAGLKQTLAEYKAVASDQDKFGRPASDVQLQPPFYGIQVTSALIQTLGGLRVDAHARVLRSSGEPIRGLYAGGGSAAGLAGDHTSGYLAGAGLLAAFGLGWIAGHHFTSHL